MEINVQPPELYNSIHELIRMAFPQYDLKAILGSEKKGSISLKCTELDDKVILCGSITIADNHIEDQQAYSFTRPGLDKTNQSKRWSRVFMYNLLCKYLHKNINSYGILTGVRPVKTVHRLLDEGYKGDNLLHRMQADYLLDHNKAELLSSIGINNHPYLLGREEAYKQISIYIGIPYCPTRCYYCSFPGAVLKNYEEDIIPFFSALQKELSIMGDYIHDHHLIVQTIYIGGGTPTVLSDDHLDDLFNLLHQKYISSDTREVTIEAGRPDTLSESKLKLLVQAGINRICINPQTMHDRTLVLIGRHHNSGQLIKSIEWARNAGINEINMDIIVGLPGEGLSDNIFTGHRLLELKPENITVHSLAVKRGSQLAEQEGRLGIYDRVEEVTQGIEHLANAFQRNGYLPYYLYRQKYMKANMENTGYSLPGHFCLYNIQVMEERQTIIGMGGGASSKFVNPSDWTLSSFHNPKDPRTYCDTIDRLITCKVDKLQALN